MPTFHACFRAQARWEHGQSHAGVVMPQTQCCPVGRIRRATLSIQRQTALKPNCLSGSFCAGAWLKIFTHFVPSSSRLQFCARCNVELSLCQCRCNYRVHAVRLLPATRAAFLSANAHCTSIHGACVAVCACITVTLEMPRRRTRAAAHLDGVSNAEYPRKRTGSNGTDTQPCNWLELPEGPRTRVFELLHTMPRGGSFMVRTLIV
jgi:hypothetical protein